MFGGTLPGIKWIAWSWSRIGGSPFGVSSEHNCEMMTRFYLFRSFVVTLELIIFPRFPTIPHNSTSFPSEKNFKKSSWKLKATIPKDCNHFMPSTTSTPPIGMENIGLFDHIPLWLAWYYGIFEKFIVPPFATITWHFGARYRKQFNSLDILQWIKLWVITESINTITLFFLICPPILRVWGVVIPSNALHDMVRIISSSSRVGSLCISFSF